MNNFLKKAIGKASQLRQGQADGDQGGEQATGEEQPQQANGERGGNQTQRGGLAGKLFKAKSFNPFG